jgi:hypothetical protein
MALVLTVAKGFEDYITIRHGGESIRIQVRPSLKSTDHSIVAFLSDSDSGASPPANWQFARKAAKERAGS